MCTFVDDILKYSFMYAILRMNKIILSLVIIHKTSIRVSLLVS